MKLYSLIIVILLTSCSWGTIFYYNESFDPHFQKKKELKDHTGRIFYPVRVGQIYEFQKSQRLWKDYLKGVRIKVRGADVRIPSRDPTITILKGVKFKIIGLCRYYLSGPDKGGASLHFVAKILDGEFKDDLFITDFNVVDFWGGFTFIYLWNKYNREGSIFLYYKYFIKNGFQEIRELGRIPCFNGNDKNKLVKLVKDSPYPVPTKKVKTGLFSKKEVVDYSWSDDKSLGKDLENVYLKVYDFWRDLFGWDKWVWW